MSENPKNDNERYSFKAFKNSKTGKKILLGVLSVVLAVLILFVAYIAYLLIDYHRIPDNKSLEITKNSNAVIETNVEYSALSYNIGFAAYTPDFGFFMDGGKESRAKSKESVNKTLGGILNLVKGTDADFIMLEEVDKKATRSHYVDQQSFLESGLKEYNSVFTVNYDSSYLFYPFTRPHGKSLAGTLTLSRFDITQSTRRSLPIEDTFMKFLDLDRCYTVSRMPVKNGKELILYTIHLSAYTSDGTIADEQFKMLVNDMQSEYEKGNYIVCGGDFNKDLLGDSGKYFGIPNENYTWAQPLKTEFLKDTALSLIAPLDKDNPIPSCRNADAPYNSDQFVVTVDGFIVSDNIEIRESKVIDTGFSYSDHNPVLIKFILN